MEILSKLLSGRYLLTVCAGFTFAFLSCNGLLPPDQALIVINSVLIFYFNKNRSEPTQLPKEQNNIK